jgi:hypothetical protein
VSRQQIAVLQDQATIEPNQWIISAVRDSMQAKPALLCIPHVQFDRSNLVALHLEKQPVNQSAAKANSQMTAIRNNKDAHFSNLFRRNPLLDCGFGEWLFWVQPFVFTFSACLSDLKCSRKGPTG